MNELEFDILDLNHTGDRMNVSLDNLVDCIFLLVNENTPSTKYTVNLILSLYTDQQGTSVFLDNDKVLAEFYVNVIKTLLDQDIDKKKNPAGLKTILIKFKSGEIYKEHKSIFNDFEKEFTSSEVMSTDGIKKLQQSLNVVGTQIKSNLEIKKCYSELNKLYNATSLESKTSGLRKIQSLCNGLTESIERDLTNKSGFMNETNFVDFRNKDSIMRQVTIYNEKVSSGNVIKTGLKGINEFFGPIGGLVGGQSLIFVAGPHQYKSGILLSMAIWAAKYNDIVPKNPKKKPLIYFPTLENTCNENVHKLFEKLYVDEHKVNPPKLTNEEESDYIYKFFESRNIHFGMEKWAAGVFTVTDFKQRIKAFQEMGYEVKLCILDYLAEMSKDIAAARDQQMKYLLVSMCDFCKEEEIALVTAHALNRSYMNLPETTNAVRKFDLQHIADGPDVARVPDMVIYMNLEYNDMTKVRYLTMALGKNRLYYKLPERKKYVAYPFINEVIGIEDDVLSKDVGYVRDIYDDARYAVNTENNSEKAESTDVF